MNEKSGYWRHIAQLEINRAKAHIAAAEDTIGKPAQRAISAAVSELRQAEISLRFSERHGEGNLLAALKNIIEQFEGDKESE